MDRDVPVWEDESYAGTMVPGTRPANEEGKPPQLILDYQDRTMEHLDYWTPSQWKADQDAAYQAKIEREIAGVPQEELDAAWKERRRVAHQQVRSEQRWARQYAQHKQYISMDKDNPPRGGHANVSYFDNHGQLTVLSFPTGNLAEINKALQEAAAAVGALFQPMMDNLQAALAQLASATVPNALEDAPVHIKHRYQERPRYLPGTRHDHVRLPRAQRKARR